MNDETLYTPSEAVLCFAAWLTTRSTPLTVGATHDASEMARLVQRFNDSQRFDPPRDDFHERGYPYPQD